MKSNLCLVEAVAACSIPSFGYVMDDLRFESRETQKITSLLLIMPIILGCTQSRP
jgi:hypothetical protein